MNIGKSFTVSANLISESDILLGICSMKGECEGCGEPVYILRFGIILGEVYLTYHAAH